MLARIHLQSGARIVPAPVRTVGGFAHCAPYHTSKLKLECCSTTISQQSRRMNRFFMPVVVYAYGLIRLGIFFAFYRCTGQSGCASVSFALTGKLFLTETISGRYDSGFAIRRSFIFGRFRPCHVRCLRSSLPELEGSIRQSY